METTKKQKLITLAAAFALFCAVAAVIAALGGKSSFSGEPKICLDAGHGGSDVGAVNGERYEKDDNLKLTLAVGDILKENGIKVIYTRKKDENVELADRAKFANKKKATHFVSIHRNSASADASGVEIWINSIADSLEKDLAKKILAEIDAVGMGENRGVKRGYQGNPLGNYLVNSATLMPSCLVEMGFITSEEDNRLFDENFDEYAAAIAKGIMNSLGEE